MQCIFTEAECESIARALETRINALMRRAEMHRKDGRPQSAERNERDIAICKSLRSKFHRERTPGASLAQAKGGTHVRA